MPAPERPGFATVSQRGSHRKLRHPDGRVVIVRMRRELATGTLASMLRQAGVSPSKAREAAVTGPKQLLVVEAVEDFLVALSAAKPSPHTLAAYRRDLVGVAGRVAAARGVEPPEIRRHGVLIDPYDLARA